MDRQTFTILYNMVQTSGRLAPTRCVDVEEIVAMFLHILAHDVKNKVVQWQFAQFSETVSKHFNVILTTVLHLHELLLKKPDG